MCGLVGVYGSPERASHGGCNRTPFASRLTPALSTSRNGAFRFGVDYDISVEPCKFGGRNLTWQVSGASPPGRIMRTTESRSGRLPAPKNIVRGLHGGSRLFRDSFPQTAGERCRTRGDFPPQTGHSEAGVAG